jgi:phosphoribosylformimino-5-aminoimidazole carboxamide ribotide isomerase
MRVVPVLDLKGGQAVAAIAGRRNEYQPLAGPQLTSSCPVEVAQVFRNQFGFHELYVADLDAIAGHSPSFATYAALKSLGWRLWIDAGVREWKDAVALADTGIERVIVGLETLSGPETLARICRTIGPDRIIFSLDLKDGEPLCNAAAWRQSDASTIASQVVRIGIRSMIVIDLAHVGTGTGTGTEELCQDLAGVHPQVELLAGGGIRGLADLRRLQQCGVRAALVASALHQGRLSAEDLAKLAS